MAGVSDYVEDNTLDHLLGDGTTGSTFAQPTGLVVALYDNNATTSDVAANLESNTPVDEVSGGSYARQSVAFDAAAGGSTSNSADVSFTDMPATDVTHAAVLDSGGNVLFWGALSSAKTLNAGDTFTISAGNFTCSLD